MLRKTIAMTLALLFGTAVIAAGQRAVKQRYGKVQSFDGTTLVIQEQTGEMKGQTTRWAVGSTPVYSGKTQVSASDLQSAVDVFLLVDASGNATKIQITASKPHAPSGTGNPQSPPNPGTTPPSGGKPATGDCPALWSMRAYGEGKFHSCFNDRGFDCPPAYPEFVNKVGVHSCGYVKKTANDHCPGNVLTDAQNQERCEYTACGKNGGAVIKPDGQSQFHCERPPATFHK